MAFVAEEAPKALEQTGFHAIVLPSVKALPAARGGEWQARNATVCFPLKQMSAADLHTATALSRAEPIFGLRRMTKSRPRPRGLRQEER
ncbi:hypothetical protein CO653_15300 [Rhizobium anhuiense]|nr:hypothetical protein AS890_09375 [Rhizobium anhuiense bv. trifolii]PDS44169.1 hypothetical protein CO668_14850 [Rhizobium anhuiense]PDS57106.1 hypothetical protein CO663_21225 [Rhizobium anhuiense]PDS64876.1 hypothetical protein CO653_15300 [Rhizobium anhuiense]